MTLSKPPCGSLLKKRQQYDSSFVEFIAEVLFVDGFVSPYFAGLRKRNLELILSSQLIIIVSEGNGLEGGSQ